MISAVLVTLTILLALGFSLRSSRSGGASIAQHPYNNRYNDASGAREDHVG